MAKKLRNLTVKQRRFIEEYLLDANATQAAVRAGYSKHTAKVIGSENLSKPAIASEIAKGRAARSLRTQIAADDVVHQLQLLATAKLGNAASWDMDNGVNLVASDELPEAEALAVQSVEWGQYGPKIKLESRTTALRMLGEHVGIFETGQQQAQMIQVNIVVDDKREVKQ